MTFFWQRPDGHIGQALDRQEEKSFFLMYFTGSDALSHLKGLYLNMASNNIRIIPPHLLPALSQQSIINLSHNPLDCTCSNIHFITWYKENLHKLEDSEETTCANPPSLRGVKLSDVKLHCGITGVGIFFIVVFVFLLILLLIFSVKFILRWKYQHI